MNNRKYIIATILLFCMLSFVAGSVMAAPNDRVITPAQKAAEKLQELDEMNVFEQRASHSKADFTNVVPGVGGLKYQAEQVPPGFEHVPETITMVSWHNEGRLHIRDLEHKTVTIQIPWSTLQDIEGFGGQHVRVWHYDDSGVCDGKWVQTVANENGFAYLESVPFSEVVVGGFTGTYSKVESEIDITDTINLGRTFDSDDVSSVTLTIDDQYSTKTDPYDIDTTGLGGWWKCDENSGTNVSDSSGNGNHGTFANANWTSTGKYNSSVQFDGLTDEILIPDSESLDLPNSHTISIWLYRYAEENPDSTLQTVLTRRPSGKYNFDVDIPTAFDKVRYTLYDGTNLPMLSTSYSPVPNEWVHWVFVRDLDEQKMKIYRNGIFDVECTDTTAGNDINGSSQLKISQSGTEYYGKTDELLIFNDALSESQIKELYYIGASSIQAKTNSHAEYSNEWNSSADNPLTVPFGASESISSLTFNQPESIEQNGVTIYNPINVLFNATATIGYTDDTYLIEEFFNEGLYIDKYAVEIHHTPSASNANGEISYNPTDSLCNDIMCHTWTPHLVTNNPQASIKTFNQNSLVIDTGAITAGTEYTYIVTAETTEQTAHDRSSSIIMDGIMLAGLIPLVSILSLIMGVVNGRSDGELDLKKTVATAGASFVSIAFLIIVVSAIINAGVV